MVLWRRLLNIVTFFSVNSSIVMCSHLVILWRPCFLVIKLWTVWINHYQSIQLHVFAENLSVVVDSLLATQRFEVWIRVDQLLSAKSSLDPACMLNFCVYDFFKTWDSLTALQRLAGCHILKFALHQTVEIFSQLLMLNLSVLGARSWKAVR